MKRKPIALMIRPHGRYPRGHKFGGRFYGRKRRFAYSEFNVRLFERIGFVRGSDSDFSWALISEIYTNMYLESFSDMLKRPPIDSNAKVEWFRYHPLSVVT